MFGVCLEGESQDHKENYETFTQFKQSPTSLDLDVDIAHFRQSLSQDDFKNIREILSERDAIPAVPTSDAGGWRSKFAFLVDSHDDRFSMLIGCVIAVNAVVCGLETDLGTEHFANFDVFFCLVYLLEMVLKLCQDGCRGYFSHANNLFDASLVLIGCADLFIVPLLKLNKSHMKTLKAARLLRSLRILRLARLFTFFHQLHLVIESYVRAVRHISYVVMMIVICLYMLSVCMTQLIGHHEDLWPQKDRSTIKEYFGTIASSMQSMFIVMTMENWTVDISLLEDCIPAWVLFPFFVLWIVIAFSLIGLFPAELCSAYLHAKQEEEKKRNDVGLSDQGQEFKVAMILRACRDIDLNHDGMLTRREVKSAMKNDEHMLARLEAVEIYLDTGQFLEILDRLLEKARQDLGSDELGDPEIYPFRIEEVVRKIVEVKGYASSSSVYTLTQDMFRISADLQSLRSEIGEDPDVLGEVLSILEEDYEIQWNEEMKRLNVETEDAERNADDLEKRIDAYYASLNAKLDSMLELAKFAPV